MPLKHLLAFFVCLSLFSCDLAVNEPKVVEDEGDRSIVLFTDSEEFADLEIENIDSIVYDDSTRQSGDIIYESVHFSFHIYLLARFKGYDKGIFDTLGSRTYPTAELYLLEETFPESDSITLRREIALADTIQIPEYPEAHYYLFWFSSNCTRSLSLSEIVKWKSATDDLFFQLAAKVKERGS